MNAEPTGVTVGAILRERGDGPDFELRLLSGGTGLSRVVTSPHIQKTGLALAGFDQFLRPGRMLIFGESEVRYLEGLPPDERRQTAARVLGREIPCIVLTGGFEPARELTEEAARAGVPLLHTPLPTPTAISKLTARLESHLAVRGIIHGVLMDVLGLGVLVIGDSGIGKSECALDLVVRGHRLVADDTVELRRRGEGVVLGSCPELTRYHMEIRGLGVINIRDLFGVAATRSSKRVELLVQLERWDPVREYDRLGLDDERHDVLGVSVPMIRMPVAPGRNLAILVEVAARNQLLRTRGHHAARELADRLARELEKAAVPDDDHGEEDQDRGDLR
ncbi:MAG TPA: HPr(Ser) kinase/phosphatase [Vicinamibacterales bacterium]|nr:HPr(Ser) kinase/phosphatase [Vicinamibacterales bacterium]